MFDFLKGDQAQFSISVDRPNAPYYPGETVHATVSLQGQKDLRVQEARVAFLYSERYQERRKEYDREDHRWETSSYWMTDNREIDKQVMVRDGVIGGNTQKTWNFDWVIPPDAPPSYDGKIVQIKWLIKATLDRKMAKDINAELELPVLSRVREQAAESSTFAAPDTSGNDQVNIELTKYDWLEGETIEGKLVVLPRSDFDVTEVRAELVRVENVPAHEGNTENISIEKVKLAGGTKFANGARTEYPLGFRVPATANPSITTPHSSVRWYVRGTLARRLRGDVQGQAEVRIYSGVPESQSQST